MTIDIRLLRQVLALSKHRNFARAAESLHISQPAPAIPEPLPALAPITLKPVSLESTKLDDSRYQ